MMVAKAGLRESQSRTRDEHYRGHDPTTKGETPVECDSRTMGPFLCIFWCAVALGALSKGWPIKLANVYIQKAKAMFINLSDAADDLVVAKAWTHLAYAHGYCGDRERFFRTLQEADMVVRKCKESGQGNALPTGFAELVQTGETAKIVTEGGEIVNDPKRGVMTLPKISKVASEGEICQVLVHGHRTLRLAISKIVPGKYTAEDTAAMAERVRRARKTYFVTFMREVEENSCGIEELEQLVKRTLIFMKTARKDYRGVLDTLKCSVEVAERYPGFFRMILGAHHAHFLVAAITALPVEASVIRNLYNRLRAAFNPMRLPDIQSIPPLEEVQGVSSFCNDTYCRSVEALLVESFSDLSMEPSCSAGCPQPRNNAIQGETVSTPAFCDGGNCHAIRDQSMEYGGITCLPERPPHRMSRETKGDNNDTISVDDWIDAAVAFADNRA